MTDHWASAVEAGAKAMVSRELYDPKSLEVVWEGLDAVSEREPYLATARTALTAALPSIRRMLAEELRAEANDMATKEWRTGVRYAADHLTRKEVP